MAQQGRKKPRRRAPRVTPIDDDLAILASVLAEHRLDENAYGWFRPPWRNGINAADLARQTAYTLDASARFRVDALAYMTTHWRLAESYEKLGEWYQRIIRDRENTTSSRLLAASARCVQLHIANSHGGGVAYNELLIPVFLEIDPASVDDLVLSHRCVDAIGTAPGLRGDAHDRKRAAFKIAWKRGLYIAAYSIPPIPFQ